MRNLLLLSLCVAPSFCQAEIVTLVLAAGQTNAALTLNQNQSARLTSFMDNQTVNLYVEGTNYSLGVISWNLLPNASDYTPVEVRGPATIGLRAELSVEPEVHHPSAMATFEITPQPFSPDKTITVPAGPGGAAITMECSTDLVNWTAATNGVYTNLLTARFFRIRAERVP